MPKQKRFIALIDMDCFYVQVEQRCRPELWNMPVAVVQYNQWRKGGLIAVGYEARARGVTRYMRGEEAQAICPEIKLVSVETQRGKADLTKYRKASEEVFKAINLFDDIVIERASIDEAYLDLTEVVEKQFDNFVPFSLTKEYFPSTYLAVEESEMFEAWLKRIQLENNVDAIKLSLSAKIVEEIRQKILEETKFHCSAGIAHNKMLAKLICSFHKPKKQTILPFDLTNVVFQKTPIQKVRLFGGKLGAHILETLNISTMAELAEIPLGDLRKTFNEATGTWLHNVSHGNDDEAVVPRQLPKSIGCSKNFPGKSSLRTKKDIQHWLQQLADELEERLKHDHISNRRLAKTFVVGLRTASDSSAVNCTRQTSLTVYSADFFVKEALHLLQEFNKSTAKDDVEWKPAITCLSIGAGKFEDSVDVESAQITDFFKPLDRKEASDEIHILKPPIAPDDNSNSSLGLDSFFRKALTRESTEKKAAQPKVVDPVTNFDMFFNAKRKLVPDEDEDDIVEVPSTSSCCSKSPFEVLTTVDCNDELVKNNQTPSSELFLDEERCSTSFANIISKSNVSASSRPAVGNTLSDIKKSLVLTSTTTAPTNLFCTFDDLPSKREEIDADTWRQLPPSIRFEITQFYRKAESIEGKTKTKLRSPPKRTKKTETCCSNGKTLLDFYDRS